jgi:hypothetical protein
MARGSKMIKNRPCVCTVAGGGDYWETGGYWGKQLRRPEKKDLPTFEENYKPEDNPLINPDIAWDNWYWLPVCVFIFGVMMVGLMAMGVTL